MDTHPYITSKIHSSTRVKWACNKSLTCTQVQRRGFLGTHNLSGILSPFCHPLEKLRGYGSIFCNNPSQKCDLCLPGSMVKPEAPRIHRSAAARNCVAEILSCWCPPALLPCTAGWRIPYNTCLVCVCVCVPHLGGNSSVRPRFPGDVSLALSTLTKERDWLTDRLSLMIECSFFWWPSDVVQTRSPCLLASSAVCRRGAALLKGGRWMHNLS